MRRMIAVICLTGLVGSFGCGDDGEGSRQAEIRSLQGDLAQGRTAYASNCQTCHGPDGSGTSVGPDIRGEADETIEVTLFGEDDMAPLDHLDNQTIADIAAFTNAGFPQ